MMRKSSNISFTTSNSKMDESLNIKVVRLQSGEDIIADVITDEDVTILNNPMVIVIRRTSTGSVMMMVPWLPVEVISDNIATLNNSEIITETNPKDSLIEYYLNAVGVVAKESEMNGDMLAKANNKLKSKEEELWEDEVEEYYEDEPNTLDDLLNSLEGPKDKKQLH